MLEQKTARMQCYLPLDTVSNCVGKYKANTDTPLPLQPKQPLSIVVFSLFFFPSQLEPNIKCPTILNDT